MAESPMCISCEECSFDKTDVCGDCVVQFLMDRDPSDAIIIEAAEVRAVRLLAGASLVPTLRYERRAG